LNRFEIELTRAAIKDIKKLDENVRNRIAAAIDQMRENPWKHDFKRILEKPGEWRLRVGTWRVIFEPDWDKKILYVRRIKHRSKAYK